MALLSELEPLDEEELDDSDDDEVDEDEVEDPVDSVLDEPDDVLAADPLLRLSVL